VAFRIGSLLGPSREAGETKERGRPMTNRRSIQRPTGGRQVPTTAATGLDLAQSSKMVGRKRCHQTVARQYRMLCDCTTLLPKPCSGA
jgi:hypothetical protein